MTACEEVGGRPGGKRARRLVLGVAVSLLVLWLESGPASAAVPGCHPGWPVVAHHAAGAIAQLPPGATLPVACAVQTGYPTSESSIAVTPTGALIYSPAQTENSLARSPDGGASWTLTTPAGEQPTAFWNTVDPFVIADRRTGWVFWSHATGPVRNEGNLPQGSGFLLAAAYGFQVYTSRDDGRTFTTADYSTQPTGDWEKIFVGPPPPASTGAAQPTGYPDVLYLCANSPLEVSGPGRLCYKSLDGGATFSPAGFSSPTASSPADSCPPLNFNTGVVDSSGTTYQPVDCSRSAYVEVSHDEGATYTWLPVPEAPTGTPVSGTNLQLAVDSADMLYGMWTTADHLYVAISRDHGRSWDPARSVAAPGLHNITRPTVAAGASGHLAVAYYASRDPSAHALSAYITQTLDALDPDPLFYSAALNDPAAPIYTDEGLNGVSPRADFVGGAFDQSGNTFWAGMVKQFGQPDANRQIATTGYVGRLEFAASTPAALPPPGTAAVVNRPAASRCVAQRTVRLYISGFARGRVVQVVVRVGTRVLLRQRGRSISSVRFPRPPARQFVITVIASSNRGARVVTTRSLRACARAKLPATPHRRPRFTG